MGEFNIQDLAPCSLSIEAGTMSIKGGTAVGRYPFQVSSVNFIGGLDQGFGGDSEILMQSPDHF